jgi:hypothetical protein
MCGQQSVGILFNDGVRGYRVDVEGARLIRQASFLWALAGCAAAQETPAFAEPAEIAQPLAAAIEPAPVAPGTAVRVPALTPVFLQIDEELSSKTSKPGDHFRLSISEDVIIAGAVVIPAGSAGEGEVIHASRAGAGGKPGEILLAARYVTVGGHEVRLRSFVVGANGKDHTDQALAVGTVVGVFAMFVHGGQIVLPRGTSAGAKTAAEIQLPALEAAPPAPLPIDTTTQGEEDHEAKTD